MASLPFDGSSLGSFEFVEKISWILPCRKETRGNRPATFYALYRLTLETEYPIILKRNCSGRTDQSVVDELKPIFGLQKMGTHRIKLKGVPKKIDETKPWLVETPTGTVTNVMISPQWSDYLIFRANTETDSNGKIRFVPMYNIGETECFPTFSTEIKIGHKIFYYEIQKILVFRELMRISETNLGDILVKVKPTVVPLSIDESKIQLPEEKLKPLNSQIELFFLAKTTDRIKTLLKMLGLNEKTYRAQIEMLRNSIAKVIIRVDETKLWMLNYLISSISDRVTLHYNVVKAEED